MKYTVFMDMFSGGSQKEDWEYICVTCLLYTSPSPRD